MFRQYIVILIISLVFVKFELNSALSVKREVNDVTVKEAQTVGAQSEDRSNTEKNKEERNRILIQKCCPFGEYVFAYNRTCRTPRDLVYRNFSEIQLHDIHLQKTGRVLPDVYTLDRGRFQNVTLRESNMTNFIRYFHRYYLTEEGILHEEVPNEYYRWYVLNTSSFCVDYELPNKFHKRELQVGFWTLLTRNEEITQNETSVNYIITGLLISSAFLVLVLLVYSVLPELRNLGGLVLMAYVASLLAAFVLLATVLLGRFSRPWCKGLTYIIYFCFLASFCWMNVMSCDVWWTFRGYAKARPIHRRGELAKFLMYCAYAWGVPLAMTTMLAVINSINMRHIPWFVTPNIPNNACFIAETSKRFYLYIPMLILVICNWVFFLMTAFNVWRLSRGTGVLDSAAAGTPAAHRKQRARFLVYLKLSIIMGLNWVMEVVSSFYPELKLFLLTDMYNILIGVSIFLIFVLKKKILRKLGRKFSTWSEPWRRSQYSKSRCSNTTDGSDVSQETPLQVCTNPKGPKI